VFFAAQVAADLVTGLRGRIVLRIVFDHELRRVRVDADAAIVAGKNDQCVFRDPCLFQRVEQGSDTTVEFLHEIP